MRVPDHLRHATSGLGLVVLLIGSLVGCAGRGLPEPDQADVGRAAARWSDVTADELRGGRALYQRSCSSCHRPVSPSAIAPAAWPAHVEEMRQRAGLSDGDARAIERYLVTIASRDR